MSARTVTWDWAAKGIVVVTMAHRPANALGPLLLNAFNEVMTAAEDAGVKVMTAAEICARSLVCA